MFLHDIDHQLEFPQIVHHKSFIHLNVHLFPLKFPVAQVNQLYWSVFRRPQGFFSGDDPDGFPRRRPTSRKTTAETTTTIEYTNKMMYAYRTYTMLPIESCQRGQCGFGNAAMRFLTRWELTNPTSLLPRRTGDGLQILVFKTFLI